MVLQVEVLVVKTTYQNIGVTYVEDYLGTVILCTIKESKKLKNASCEYDRVNG